MPSIRPTVPLLTTVTLTGALLLAGCGSGENDNDPKDSGAAPSTAGAEPADPPASTAAAAAYNEPMDIAKKIRKANLGCTKPQKTESLGTGKVICGGTDNISIEFYPNPQAFTEVKKALCGMGMTPAIVADEGRRWMVTTLSTATTERVHKAVGGKLVKVC